MIIFHKFAYLLLIFQPIVCANIKFPDDFLFGVASSAYQIEGGYDSRGKTTFDHHWELNSSMVADSSNAKTACDSYNQYQKDIDLLVDLGVNFYRFSISWPRILPRGFPNEVNPDGIRYYNNLIDGLLAKNIQPMVTMFHFDLPKPLQDLGGWTNPVISDLFEDYARILFKNFGNRVKYWITINSNTWGYGDSDWPPMVNQSGFGDYLCVKNTVLGHAKVYHLSKREFREQKSQIGFVVDGRWYEPASESSQNRDAAERAREFNVGIWLNPIYGSGDFPAIVKQRVKTTSEKEGFSKSRLPEFTPDEINFVKNSFDFLGVNIYTSFLVKDVDERNDKDFSWDKDMKAEIYQDSRWEGAKSNWLKVTPWGLRKVLGWIKQKYNNPPMFITENGFSDGGEIEDLGRVKFMELYLKALLEAIDKDRVKVKGYAAWSLLDNFEWLVGYTEKFGLYHVDFADPHRKRTPKSSSKWYKKLIERRQLDEMYKTEL
ncbi:myrosinase 1-like [Tribolium madens]|uniref:myrosinase 1-like n=1 Tax=Tribolium madens TaxID=41895 RepID=UPI001CF75692|nr:myrosinase 1-like [Tribolium madens]